MKQFDVVVVGGGHAGCEAAHVAARMGCTVALVTMRRQDLGVMSCNPAIGGIGKGHLVREIDALDGVIGKAADAAGIQFRLLNRSKGPAVQGPRAQADRHLFRQAIQREMSRQSGLHLIEGEVSDLLVKSNQVYGVGLASGEEIFASKIILTTGTFLNGLIHIGDERTPAGRMGSNASNALAARMYDLDLPIGRLKTGTPPRLVSKSIDWSAVEMQPGDSEPTFFSFLTNEVAAEQVECGITHTNAVTHEIIQENLEKSAMYAGHIEGTGPRYCPSIEDKVVRFSEKTSHQIFLEPEGLSSSLVYPNGISTSLPREVQESYVRSICGLQNVEISQYGYAIEYDYVDPRCLEKSLALPAVRGLYLAGQINGTTGYEEAAAQGLVAGINAASCVKDVEPVVFERSNSYIGVLVDDLTTRGVSEPYRMFTSRAEFRLALRVDNADQRLTPAGIDCGCVGSERATTFDSKLSALEQARSLLGAMPTNESWSKLPSSATVSKKKTFRDLLSIRDVSFDDLVKMDASLSSVPETIRSQLEKEAVYVHYLDRQKRDIERAEKDKVLLLPDDFEYGSLSGLSGELSSKLNTVRPRSIDEASRIEGMTPSALALLAVHARKSVA